MKTMTCKQLGGVCDLSFHANTFEEIAQLSQAHGMEMFEQKDESHLKAMELMSELSRDPEAMEQWMTEKKREFDLLPEDK